MDSRMQSVPTESIRCRESCEVRQMQSVPRSPWDAKHPAETVECKASHPYRARRRLIILMHSTVTASRKPTRIFFSNESLKQTKSASCVKKYSKCCKIEQKCAKKYPLPIARRLMEHWTFEVDFMHPKTCNWKYSKKFMINQPWNIREWKE